jgi:hypothetical protein
MRRLTTAAAALALAGGLTGCGLFPRSEFEDSATISETVRSVRLDVNEGRVTLRGRDGRADVSLLRTVEYRGDRPGVTYRVENGVLVLEGCGRNCAVHYEIDLPAGLAVTGGTSNGALTLSRLGAVDVHTSNGRIEGTELGGGGVDVETSNGAVDITTTVAQDVRVRTSNGEVTVTVPPGPYRVAADTSNGDRNVAVDDDPSAAHTLDISTSNGDITVRTG